MGDKAWYDVLGTFWSGTEDQHICSVFTDGSYIIEMNPNICSRKLTSLRTEPFIEGVLSKRPIVLDVYEDSRNNEEKEENKMK